MTRSTFRPHGSGVTVQCFLTAATALGCATGDHGAPDLGSSSSSLVENEDPDLATLAASYYTAKHGVSEREAVRRLAIQDRASGIEDDLTRVLGSAYAGTWYDHEDGGKLKVGLTRAGASKSAEVWSVIERYGVADDSALVAVDFSEAALESIRDDVATRIMDMIEIGHARTAYNTKENIVRVTALVRLPEDEERRLATIAAMSGVSIRRIDEATLRGTNDSCNITYCNAPLRGGRQIVSNASCTSAFIAHANSDPTVKFAMTAGHCPFFNGGGFSLTWVAKDEANAFHTIGAQVAWLYAGASGKDCGLINVAPTSFWASPAPAPFVVVKTSPATTYNPQYKISKDSKSSLGQILCRTGATTGTACAEVQDLGETLSVTGPDGIDRTLTNMGELDMCGGLPGDSGGPIYKKHTAFGIYSGHASGVFTCYEFYQGIRAAQQALGVTLDFAP
jgi:hypothetical protein